MHCSDCLDKYSYNECLCMLSISHKMLLQKHYSYVEFVRGDKSVICCMVNALNVQRQGLYRVRLLDEGLDIVCGGKSGTVAALLTDEFDWCVRNSHDYKFDALDLDRSMTVSVFSSPLPDNLKTFIGDFSLMRRFTSLLTWFQTETLRSKRTPKDAKMYVCKLAGVDIGYGFTQNLISFDPRNNRIDPSKRRTILTYNSETDDAYGLIWTGGITNFTNCYVRVEEE